MVTIYRDGWEGEPKRTVNAFTFQVNINININTFVNTIILIIIISPPTK